MVTTLFPTNMRYDANCSTLVAMNTSKYQKNGIHLQCKRGVPRFKTTFSAKAESEFFCISATVTNLSASGLQFECEHEALPTLMPNLTRPNSHLPIQFHIRFQVPTQTKAQTPIDLVCCLVHARRISHKTAAVGCQFSSFEGNSERDLLNYITYFGTQC